MTTEFKTVSPERAVQIMRAWAFHPWPMTVQDGIDVYTSLGFKGDPQEPRFFTSDMSPSKTDSSFIVSEGVVNSCRLRLSNWVSSEHWAMSLPRSRNAFTSFVNSFTEILGKPFSTEDEETDFSAHWILESRVGVDLGGNRALIILSIDSPEETGYLLDDLEAEANGEEIGADYF